MPKGARYKAPRGRHITGASERKSPAPRLESERHARVRSLACHDQVRELLVHGESTVRVAAYIQETRRELTDVSRKSLRKALERYRRDIPASEFVYGRRTKTALLDEETVLVPKVVAARIEELKGGIKELDRMEKLYEFQWERMQQHRKTERGLPMLAPGFVSEVREMRKVLREMARLKMDLGILTKAPDEVNVNLRAGIAVMPEGRVRETLDTDPRFAGVIEDPDKRRKVMSIFDEMRAEIDAEIVEIEEGEPEGLGGPAPTEGPDEASEAETVEEGPTEEAPYARTEEPETATKYKVTPAKAKGAARNEGPITVESLGGVGLRKPGPFP